MKNKKIEKECTKTFKKEMERYYKISLRNIAELNFGKVRNDVLPKGFIERVIKYKKTLKEVEKSTVEEAINNFMRDLNPENELII